MFPCSKRLFHIRGFGGDVSLLMNLFVLPCVQVIMIECADLKNVINYQEVEALKHTIKVYRKEGESEGSRYH